MIAPFRLLPGARHDVLLLCDHASNAMPPELGDLGLPPEAFARHIAWDIGAAEVAERLARRLDAPAFFGGVSRLVVDLNRAPDAPDLIVEQGDGMAIPGNRGLGDGARRRRIADWHRPYHDAIGRHLDACLREGIRPVLLSVHSFTPSWCAQARPWPIGLLWKTRTPWLDALFDVLRAQGLDVGDNQPYDDRVLQGHTMQSHGAARGLRHVTVELRQDLLEDAAARWAWAERLHEALAGCGVLAPQ